MSAAVNHWKLGLFVAAGFLMALAAIFWLGTRRLDRDRIEMITYFNETVAGLDVGAPVKIRGVNVGSVDRITIAPDRRHVEVGMWLYVDVLERLGIIRAEEAGGFAAWPIPEEVRMQLSSTGITGIKFIELNYFEVQSNPIPVLEFETPPNYIPAASSTLKNLETNVTETLIRLPTLMEDLTELVGDLDTSLGALDLGSLGDQTRSLLTQVETDVAGWRAGELSKRLEDVLLEAEGALNEFRLLGQQWQAKDGPIEQMSLQVADAVQELKAQVESLQLGAISADLRRAIQALEGSATQVDGLVSDSRSFLDEGKGLVRAGTGMAQEGGMAAEALRHELVTIEEALVAVRDLARLMEQRPDALLRGRTPQGTQADRRMK